MKAVTFKFGIHIFNRIQSKYTCQVTEVLCCRCYQRDFQSVVVVPQARLKEIGKLDQWLQTAVREGNPQAMQAVCATQWSFCLPLLQHNLRKHIKAPLLSVAQVLEDMQRFPASLNSPWYMIMCVCLRASQFVLYMHFPTHIFGWAC